jgi:hypothetical protein
MPNLRMAERAYRWLHGSSTLENALFCVLLLACVIPIWWLPEIPTQDGPAHLYNAYLLSGWWKSPFPIDRTFFALNPAPVPNWLSTFILAILMQIFSAQTAERMLMTLYVVLLPCAFRYASRSFDRISHYTYFVVFALVWNHLFQLGFFNFCLSLVWYLFFLGYWATRRSRLGGTEVAGLLGLSILLYFSNGLSYYLAAATVGLLSLAVALMEPRDLEQSRWKSVLKPQAGALVALPLSVGFFALHGRSHISLPSHMTLQDISWSISRVSILVSSFNAIDLKLSALFGVVLFIAAAKVFYSRRHSRLLFSDFLLLAAAGQLILFVALPERAWGGGEINYRTLLFSLATFALWIAIQPFHKLMVVAIAGVATVVCLGLVARSFQRNLWLSAGLYEYRQAASQIEQHKSLLRLQFEPIGYGRTRDPGLRYDPFLNASALVALDRDLVDLDNYETASRNFPIVYRKGFDPMTVIRNEGPSAYRPLADIAQYEAMTGRTVDYVLLWDVQRWNPASPFGKMALQQLYRDYVLIYCARNIPLQLYRLRGQVNSAQVAPNCPLAAAGE